MVLNFHLPSNLPAAPPPPGPQTNWKARRRFPFVWLRQAAGDLPGYSRNSSFCRLRPLLELQLLAVWLGASCSLRVWRWLLLLHRLALRIECVRSPHSPLEIRRGNGERTALSTGKFRSLSFLRFNHLRIFCSVSAISPRLYWGEKCPRFFLFPLDHLHIS